MRFFVACLSLGLFSWLSYGVWFGTIQFSDTGNSKARALKGAIRNSIETFGVDNTALLLLGVGAALSFAVIAFGARDEA